MGTHSRPFNLHYASDTTIFIRGIIRTSNTDTVRWYQLLKKCDLGDSNIVAWKKESVFTWGYEILVDKQDFYSTAGVH